MNRIRRNWVIPGLLTLAVTGAQAGPKDWQECDFSVPEEAPPTALASTADVEQLASQRVMVQAYVARVTGYLDGGCALTETSHRRLLGQANLVAQEYNASMRRYCSASRLRRWRKVIRPGRAGWSWRRVYCAAARFVQRVKAPA